MEYLLYMPLFESIHDKICKDPLDSSTVKYLRTGMDTRELEVIKLIHYLATFNSTGTVVPHDLEVRLF